jgi:hypothetical protein
MKIEIKDIINKHKNEPIAVCGHGGSLFDNRQKIEQLQKENKLLRMSVSDWWDFFSIPPDYFTIANTSLTIQSIMNKLNHFKIPVFFDNTIDPTPYSTIKKELKCDYLGYDRMHLKNKNCVEIVQDFLNHLNTYHNHDFYEYGNNAIQWQKPRFDLKAKFATAGFNVIPGSSVPLGYCCKRKIKGRLTVQEELQKYTNYNQHYSTGDTVAVHAIAFAILMGCNPIYLTGIDLDYSTGYANNFSKVPKADINVWKDSNKNLLNDLNILNESAKNIGTKIISLNKTWYGIFDKSFLNL